jgi:predicted metal-dependent peptidase
MSEWMGMSIETRIRACHFDYMRHADMALLSGIVTMGEVYVEQEVRKMPAAVATACTDGLHCWYFGPFLAPLEREEVRFVVGHENFHKGLMHCTRFKEALVKFPGIAGIAMDYVVNALLHQADPGWTWMRPPSTIKIYLDQKYYGWSFPQVLMDLIKQCKDNGGDPSKDGPKGPAGPGQGDGKEGVDDPDGPFDGHIPSTHDAVQAEKIEKDVENALHQGQILSKGLKSRGTSGSGGSLSVTDITERKTNWRDQLRDFVCNVVRGNDVARWSRINGRIFAATNRQVILPTLYNESVGHVGIFADTSGSMYGVYPVLFGEIARIVEDVRPEKVTLIWWDTRVAKVQEFLPEQYGNIKSLLSPGGGGGTEPQVVADYINLKRLKFQCGIWLTDGYIGDEPTGMHAFPQLWGVVDNEDFNAKSGKTVHISSLYE